MRGSLSSAARGMYINRQPDPSAEALLAAMQKADAPARAAIEAIRLRNRHPEMQGIIRGRPRAESGN